MHMLAAICDCCASTAMVFAEQGTEFMAVLTGPKGFLFCNDTLQACRSLLNRRAVYPYLTIHGCALSKQALHLASNQLDAAVVSSIFEALALPSQSLDLYGMNCLQYCAHVACTFMSLSNNLRVLQTAPPRARPPACVHNPHQLTGTADIAEHQLTTNWVQTVFVTPIAEAPQTARTVYLPAGRLPVALVCAKPPAFILQKKWAPAV